MLHSKNNTTTSPGTSSRSTKLIHGGIRYLQNAVFHLDKEQWDLVCEALAERKNLLESAPHLSAALPIMIPVYQWFVYRILSLGRLLALLIPGQYVTKFEIGSMVR